MLRDLAIAWLLLLAWAVPASAETGAPERPRPRQLTVADGLPSNVVTDLVEDRHGYLWIATGDGLARYDGTGFRVWRKEHGLPDSFVWSLALDGDGHLWIGTSRGGLAVYDPLQDSFRLINRENTPELASNEIWALEITPDGDVWIGTADAGLHRRTPDGRIVQYLPGPGDAGSLPFESVTKLLTGPDGTLWVGTSRGAARWTGAGFERFPEDALPHPYINNLYCEADGTLWIGTPRGVVSYDRDGRLGTASWRAGQPSLDPLQILLRDARGDYWVDVGAGLGHASGGTIRNVPLYSAATQGLVRPQWVAAHEDREGGVWLLSNGHALWYQPAHWRRFTVLNRRLDDPDSLGNGHVRGIAPGADGDMWLVGSGGVLDRFDPDTGRIRHVLDGVGGNTILDSVHQDRNGRVWVGWKNGLARIEPESGTIRRWSGSDTVDAVMAGDVLRFVETDDGLLWIDVGQGDVQARDLEGRVRREFRAGDGSGLAHGEIVNALRLGPDGRPWLATTAGLRRLRAQGDGWEPVPGSTDEALSDFAPAAGGRLWLAGIGTLDACRWDGRALDCERWFGPEHGLPLLRFSGVTVDAAGVLWLGSVRGLVRADPQARIVRVYGVHDGLPGQEFRAPVARPGDGRILAATPEGLVVFDPATIVSPDAPSNLVVERVEVRNRNGTAEFAPPQPFSIDHDARDLRVAARLLSFRNPEANVYAFRLDGYEEDWTETGALGERVFSQLAPGRYTLQVRARNADNVWSQVHEIAFTVLPPWWKTPWALALFVLTGLLLAWWIAAGYRKRLRRRHAWQLAEHKRELAEQASEAKTRFLATLGHEVRTPMTGVLGMSELLLETGLEGRQRGYAESIRRAGEHLMRLVNDALDLARIEAGKLQLDPQAFDLRGLLQEVGALMAPMARQRGLAYVEEVAPAVPAWVRGDAGRVRQILLNLLGNAIKFTEAGEVALRVSALRPEGVRFEVSDTGPGLNAEQKQRLFRRFEQAEGARTAARYGGSGLGLAICQELAAAMGGRIEVESAPGEGTRFIVELPLWRSVATESQKPAVVAPSPLSPRHLLLVEDDPIVAEVVVGLLHAQGHRVTHAAHGLAALTEVAAQGFDLGLLDLDLPGIDGLALARQLRAQGFTRPLIAITARADAEAEPLARAAGFDGFLRKPVTGAMLAEAIDAVAASRSSSGASSAVLG